MTNEHLVAIRERADSVLDGMAKHRERVAQDAKELCDEVLRLNRVILGIKLRIAAKEKQDQPSARMFSDDFWKEVFKN